MPNFLRCIETDVKNDEEFEMIRNMSGGSLVEELIGSEKVALFFLKSINVLLAKNIATLVIGGTFPDYYYIPFV